MGHINNQTVVPTNCTYCADESKVTVLKYSFNHRLAKSVKNQKHS